MTFIIEYVFQICIISNKFILVLSYHFQFQLFNNFVLSIFQIVYRNIQIQIPSFKDIFVFLYDNQIYILNDIIQMFISPIESKSFIKDIVPNIKK